MRFTNYLSNSHYLFLSYIFTFLFFQPTSEDLGGESFTEKIKTSGPELLFGYLLRLVNLLVGIVVFTVLMQLDSKYADTIEKVRAASGFSISQMIYFVCPAALLLSGLLNIAYHAFAEPWRAMGISEKWTLRQLVPKPKGKIITKTFSTIDHDDEPEVQDEQGAGAGPNDTTEYENWEEDYDQMEDREEKRGSEDKDNEYDYMG